MTDFIAGIDIGGTKIAVAIAAPGREVIARTSFPTDACRLPSEQLADAVVLLERFAEEHRGRLRAVGIGCAGPLDFERGVVISPPNMPRNWREFPLRSFVENRLGLPVALDNDANAAALGEHLFGAGRGFHDLVYMTISTGIGVGIIAGDKLVHRLGEGGHVTVQPGGDWCGCGARGCLEALCSGTGIARRAQEQLLDGRSSSLRATANDIALVTAKHVTEAVRANDELACAVWQETVSLLGIGIGSIIVLLAPQAVILGGGVAAGAGELLLRPLRAELNERLRVLNMDKVQILKAGLGMDSGLYGALALGTRALEQARDQE
jgi:glucokinase